ncbi:patatin-like protein [Saccharopolyspora mangrovi]|uniref:Patatin-like protein n=1 Tax=Saccharopolyspora mangrovi TaxID=3082379 RepID=A0ABU6A339_9PSEU|nr:patatin-like protein [Saccharopolyspora sp. S2-29]MEB3365992.1 patatin-like protein [Saccharopolyspora sp. S2-29]
MDDGDELRLALAMRGGASMAVWIGGAVAEINRLRESVVEDGESEHPWAALARLAGYRSASVDVLAGASAGGLNAALMSATLVHGLPFDRMRRMWVQLADLEAMSRPVPRFWQRGPESLLEGDDYFRAEFARLIRENCPPEAEQPGRRADLLLTATLLDPLVEPHHDHRVGPMPLERRDARLTFHHEGRAGDPLSDFGEVDGTALRLAHAARTSSSFPFAFEPAKVHSGPGEPPPGEPNMLGLFSETTTGATPFRVIDGGVLDNIPVTAAIEAIAEAPADRPTRRFLLYLNPDPVVSRGQRRTSARAVPVAAAALRGRFTQESLLSDLDELAEHNRTVGRNALRRRALFAPLRENPERLAELSESVAADNAVVRAEWDAQAVHALLTDPAGCEDGTLLPPVIGDPLAEWSATTRDQLPERLSAAAQRTGPEIFDDARGLIAAVAECLGWAWDVERAAQVGTCKAQLYRLRTFATVLAGHADRYWINGARLEPIVETAELDDWIRRVQRRRERLQHRLPSPIEPLLGAVLRAVSDGDGFQQALAEFAAELQSIVESSGADAAPDSDGIDAVARAREVLHDIADRLAESAPSRPEAVAAEQVGHALLETTDRRPEVLRQLVVLTAPLDVGRVPNTRIDLLRVVSDERTPLPFTALRRDGALRIEDKIRGMDLGSFGAFLSAKWRANDWMWGRMDAAATLVGMLADPERLARRGGPEQLGEALQAIVSRPTEAELGVLEESQAERWRGFLAEVWARHAGEVRAELDALFDAPDDRHPLTATRELLTERLQWTIAAAEVPFVESVPLGADPSGAADPVVPVPDELARSVERFDVGRQRVPDLGEARLLSMATRFGLLGHRAARPRGGGVLRWLGGAAMTLIKPVLMLVAFVAVAPRRAALLGFLAAAALALTGAGTPSIPANAPAGLLPGDCPPRAMCAVSVAPSEVNWLTVAEFSGARLGAWSPFAALAVVGFAIWFGRRIADRFGTGLARWFPALAFAAVLLAAAFALAGTGLRFGPLGAALVATALTWPAAVAYRPRARVVATVLTPLATAATALFCITGRLEVGAWLVLTALALAYVHTLHQSTADVLHPRPRPTRGGARGEWNRHPDA